MAAKLSKIPVIDTTESSKIPVFFKREVKLEPGEIDEDGFTFIGTFNNQDPDSSEEHSADITEPVTQIKDCMVVISATERAKANMAARILEQEAKEIFNDLVNEVQNFKLTLELIFFCQAMGVYVASKMVNDWMML